MSKLSNDAVVEAVAAILKHALEEKKRGFTETIELQVALKNYDPNKDKRFSGTIRLPVAPKTRFTVAIIGDAKHLEEAKVAGAFTATAAEDAAAVLDANAGNAAAADHKQLMLEVRSLRRQGFASFLVVTV